MAFLVLLVVTLFPVGLRAIRNSPGLVIRVSLFEVVHAPGVLVIGEYTHGAEGSVVAALGAETSAECRRIVLDVGASQWFVAAADPDVSEIGLAAQRNSLRGNLDRAA